jgi:hypothetical protein
VRAVDRGGSRVVDPDQAAPVDLDQCRLALDAAVAQLVHPSTEKIARADGMLDEHVAAQRAEERAVDAELAARHARYLKGRQHAQARRTLEQLSDHRRRVAAGRGSEAVTTTSAVVPSLLDQLLDQVGGNSDSGGAGAGAHRSPIALAAAELVGHIQRTIRWGRIASGDTDPHPDVRVQIRRWAARAPTWHRDHPDHLIAAAHAAESWVASIRALISPGKRTTITEPCPHCHRHTARVQDDTGETVQRPALEVDLTHKTARCWGCNSGWPAEFLAELLAQQRAEQLARDHTNPTPEDHR